MIFVAALPLLLVFLFAVVDLGRAVFLHMALNDAAYAVCRTATGTPPGEGSDALFRQSALAASPGLAGDAIRLDVSVRYGEPEAVPYVHRWFDERAGTFAERSSYARRRTVVVECVLRGTYLTPLGAALALAEGAGDSSFAYRAQVRGACDETVEGGEE